MDENYVYTATSSGSDIIDIESERNYAYIHYSDGFTSIWGNNTTVFFGTAASGIKYFSKSNLTGDLNTPIDLTDYLRDFKSYPNITSNNIRHLHGRDDKLMCCTMAGVDFFKLDPQGYRSSTTVSGADKCFVTPGRNVYYTTYSGGEYRINKLNHALIDWSEPHEVYNIQAGLKINDLFVTENTSVGGTKNTLFIATTSGIYVVDEKTFDTDVYYTYNGA